jgi:phage-related protein
VTPSNACANFLRIRVVYTARLQEIIYVLHAFQKKTQATTKKDIDIAKTRWIDLIKSKK